MKKKLFSIVLAFCLMLTLLPATALADTSVTAPEPTYEWYTGVTEGTEYTISSLSDYLGFVKLTQGAVDGVTTGATEFSGKTVKLACDVDFDGIPFLYRDASDTITSNWRVGTFKGVFDGQGHTIKNVTYTDECTSGTCGMAIFRTVYGTVKNLNVENVTATANTTLSFGGIVSTLGNGGAVEISNCHVKNANVTVNTTSGVNGAIGGLARLVHINSEIKDCSVTDFTVTTNNMVCQLGGLIGWFYISNSWNSTGAVSNCLVKNFTADVASLGGWGDGAGGNFGGIGGMLGYGHDGRSDYAFPITSCTVDGVNITVGKAYNYTFVGGFIGMSRRRYAASDCTVKNGSITVGSASDTKQVYVGGFCGAPTGAVVGDTSGWSQNANGAAVSFEDCKVEGVDVIVSGSCVAGGFAGIVGACFSENSHVTKNSASFKNCTVSGVVYAEKEAGGFAGKVNHSSTFDETCSAENVMVVAASEDTKSNDQVNDEKIGAAVITGADKIKPAAVITAPEGEKITAANGVIELPAGTTVTTNGATTTLPSGGKIEDDVLAPYASAVALDQGSLTLFVGETASLTATTDPADSPVEWSSTAPSIATVDANGSVTAVSVGTATITATSGAVSASCAVTVQNRAAVSLPVGNVNVSSGLNGSAEVDRDQARQGSIVTVTVAPNAGSALDSLSVTDANGNVIPVTHVSGNKYSFVMPATDVAVRATFTDGAATGFVDVPADKYFYNAVNWAVANGITSGVDATHFAPYASCTRGQLVTFLWRAAGCPAAKSTENPYSDARESSSFYKAILWAAENGIVTGYNDGTFQPNKAISRQQTAAILYRYAKFAGMDVSVGEDTNILSFNDALSVSEYAVSAFQWATGAQVITGNGANLLPYDTCTRAQIVTMLYRLLAK